MTSWPLVAEVVVAIVVELFLVKKYLLVGASGMLLAGGSVDERCMYVTPIRLDVLLNTNQISCCKGFDFFIPLPFNKYEYKYLEN